MWDCVCLLPVDHAHLPSSTYHVCLLPKNRPLPMYTLPCSAGLLATLPTPSTGGLVTCAAVLEGGGLVAGCAGGALALVDLRLSLHPGPSAAPPLALALAHAYGVRALALAPGGCQWLGTIGAPRPARAPEIKGGGGYRAGDSRGRAAAVGADTSVLQVRWEAGQ
jgi:hypothetical protein